MWEHSDKNLSLYGSGRTIKYTKSSNRSMSNHKKRLSRYMNYSVVLKINYATPISIGIVADYQYIELITIGGGKLLTFEVANGYVNIIRENVLLSTRKLENNNTFNLAICFSLHTNSVTVIEEKTIEPIRQNNELEEHEDTHANILSRSEDVLNPLDKIVVVNYDKDELVLPSLSKNKILTIIRSFDSSEKTNNCLLITTVFPCTINDKESVRVCYNNSINLCGIEKLNKWFII